MNNNISSITACNLLTQQPSNTYCKQVQGDQLKSVLRSLSPDCNKTTPVNERESVSDSFLIHDNEQSLHNQYA
jgi:hypothetical protein